MEALNFLKFWRLVPAATSPLNTDSTSSGPHLVLETDSESEEEDSLFDLELSFPEIDKREIHNIIINNNNNNVNHEAKNVKNNDRLDCLMEGTGKTAKMADRDGKTCLEPTFSSLTAADSAFKRRIHPLEMSSKPQSPIALLKSAPSFRVLLFKKTKSESEMENQKQRKQGSQISIEKIDEIRSCPFLSRVNSSRGNGSDVQTQGLEGSKPEKMSKDIIQKYVKIIKPLYVKVSRRYTDKVKVSEEISKVPPQSFTANVSFPSLRKDKQGNVPAGLRGACKHLGKSKSASAAIGVASPVNKSDDTLQQQHDEIQSAILHCKKSFNSSPDFSLRKSASDSIAEKSVTSVRNLSEGKHGVAED